MLSSKSLSADYRLKCACDKSFADDLVSSGCCKYESKLCLTIYWGFCRVSSICSSLIRNSTVIKFMVSSMSSLKKFLGGVVSVEESLTVVPCPLFCFVSRLILKLYLDEIQGPRLCIRFGCAGEAPFFFGSSMPTYHRCRVITYLISHRSHFGSRYNICPAQCGPFLLHAGIAFFSWKS